MGHSSTKQTKEESEEKLMKEEQLRNQINDIIEGEIQLGINEFLEEKQRKKVIRDWVLSLQKKQRNSKSKSSKTKLTKS